MDYPKQTLGELLSHPSETIRRNATSILKQLQRQSPQQTHWCSDCHKNKVADRGDVCSACVPF